MIFLALASAGATGSVVVWDSDRPDDRAALAEGSLAPGRDQADRLVELLMAALADAGLGPMQLDLVAVDHGPGSFTGVRSGVAAARALALAARLPVMAVSGLEAIAASATVAPPAATRLAAIDARRGQVYAQAFLPDMTPVAGPRALDPAAALDDLPAGPVHVVGSGAALVRAAALDGRAITCEVIQPSAGAVARRAAARLAAGEAPLQGFALEPLYLRPPDARPPTPLVATAARVTMAAAGA